MIYHSVAFKLKHAAGSQLEIEFLRAAQKLADIPGVNNFKCLRQISKKNNFDFGLSMDFESIDDYQSYNDHPDHVHFVEDCWVPEVTDFLEIDYKLYCEA